MVGSDLPPSHFSRGADSLLQPVYSVFLGAIVEPGLTPHHVLSCICLATGLDRGSGLEVEVEERSRFFNLRYSTVSPLYQIPKRKKFCEGEILPKKQDRMKLQN